MSTESSLLIDGVRMIMLRDLKSTDAQIAAYPDEASMWLTPSGISNPAGTLALHIAGNLRHFIGAVLGKSEYVRDRDAEFFARDVPREKIRAEIAAAVDDVNAAFDRLTATSVGEEYPIPVGQGKIRVRTSDWIIHLAGHLTYHLGQIDYHRRLTTTNPLPVENLALHGLARD